MSNLLLVLAVLAALDIAACGVLLALAWAIHRKSRRAARAAGRDVPPAATGEFAFLAVLGAAGILVLYATVWTILAG